MSGRGHVPAENMRLWREQLCDNRELRHLQLTALARAVADALEENEGLPLELPELEAPREAGAFWQAVTTDERLALCREILALRPDLLQTAEPLSLPPAAPRLARLAGEVFSRAADGFAPLLPGARAVYVSALSELTEAVAAGEADLAILPIEDAKGTRFLQFYEELERLDLHVTHTCDVPLGEEGQHGRFALISRLYAPAAPIRTQRIVECRVPSDDPRSLTELLTVAADAGLVLRRLDAMPVSYAEDGFHHYPIFFAPKGTALLEVYLHLFLPGVAVLGQYLHIKE